MASAAGGHGGEPPGAWLLVSSLPPHLIAAASPAWLEASGYSENEVLGRSAALLQGSGTCLVASGALWTAVQASAAHVALTPTTFHRQAPTTLPYRRTSLSDAEERRHSSAIEHLPEPLSPLTDGGSAC